MNAACDYEVPMQMLTTENNIAPWIITQLVDDKNRSTLL